MPSRKQTPEQRLRNTVLRSLRNHPGQRLDRLHSGAVAAAADDLTTNDVARPGAAILKRLLQDMRKQGVIEYAHGIGWRIKPAAGPSDAG